jgi:alkanesulfonate monooxygenase SsuD/methylene tetrahydromethanopterin reductase-like flavin-dependent oxidoreductase (luciferase family)
MRFSIFHVPTSWDPVDDREVIDAMIEEALLADELGFAAVMLPEHHFTGFSPAGSDAMVLAAYLAPQLRQAYLGFAIVVVPESHPVRMVERINLLDQLTKGRALFGVGSGFHPVELVGLGLHPQENLGEISEQHLELAERLWAKEADDPTISFATEHYRGSLVQRIVPAPFTKPRPKLMGVGLREASIVRSATAGWPVFFLTAGATGEDYATLVTRVRRYRELLIQANHPPDVLEHCLKWSTSHLILVAVAETDELAEREALVALEGHQRNLDRQLTFTARAYEAAGITDVPARPRFPPTTSREYMDSACIIGSPETVIRKLTPLAELGMGMVNMSFNLGTPQDAQRRRLTEKWMRMFADEVMPAFSERPVPRHPSEVDLEALAGAGPAPDAQINQVV